MAGRCPTLCPCGKHSISGRQPNLLHIPTKAQISGISRCSVKDCLKQSLNFDIRFRGANQWLRTYPLYLDGIMPAQEKVNRLSLLLRGRTYSDCFMQIFVNNKAYTLEQGATVATMLHVAGISEKNGLAVAVNSDVIARDQWPLYILNNNDKIMIIRATQGG